MFTKMLKIYFAEPFETFKGIKPNAFIGVWEYDEEADPKAEGGEFIGGGISLDIAIGAAYGIMDAVNHASPDVSLLDGIHWLFHGYDKDIKPLSDSDSEFITNYIKEWYGK